MKKIGCGVYLRNQLNARIKEKKRLKEAKETKPSENA